MRVLITPSPFSPNEELARLTVGRTGDVGALASFVGYCRAHSDAGPVVTLELEHYSGFTEAEVERLATRVAARHRVDELIVVHRAGAILAGEAIVLVAALSRHRAAAFAAVTEMMDYLKTDAPFWKREVGATDSRWIEPTAADYSRRQEHMK
jgi:molybdopterin synthase catalytic subunit